MNKNVYIGKVKDGKFTKGKAVKELFGGLEGKTVSVVIYDGEKRSLAANNYFHKCCQILGDFRGVPLEVQKIEFKDEYKMYDDVIVNNKVRRIYHPTHNMGTKQFARVVENLLQYAAECGVVIPTPDEYFEGVKPEFN